MIRKWIITSYLIIFCTTLLADDDTPKPRMWYVNPGFGISVPFSRVNIKKETDHLINYSDFNYYFKMKGIFFPFKKLGLGFSVHVLLTPSYDYSTQNNNLRQILKQRYLSNYYIIDNEESGYYENFVFAEGYFGLTYRYKKANFEIQPSIMVGFNSIETKEKNYFLKEKGNNNVLLLTYKPSGKFSEQILFSSSVSGIYKLNNRLKLNLDLQYSYFKIDFEYHKSIKNQITQEILANEYFEYKNSIHKFLPSVGIIVEL